MIWGIGAACMAGIIIFHFLNLARFKRQVFNQFDIIRKVARQNRVVRNLREWLILLNRLALLVCVCLFITTCARQEEKAGNVLVYLPKISQLNKAALATIDSLINRSGLVNATHSNVLTADLDLKTAFPPLTYSADADSLLWHRKKAGYSLDSLQLTQSNKVQFRRSSDTTITFEGLGDGASIAINGKQISKDRAKREISLNQTRFSEVAADGWQYYFATNKTQPTLYLAPEAKSLATAFDGGLFTFKAAPKEASVLVGPEGLESDVKNKGIIYIPTSSQTAQKDFAHLGIAAQIGEMKRSVIPDTFDQIDKGYFNYALLPSSQTNLPLLTGLSRFRVSGYSVPIIYSSAGQVLASILPSSFGNTVVFLHCPLTKQWTNLPETELFLPLLYSLAQKVTQAGKVEYYDLCEKQSQSKLAELTATADSLRYQVGFAKPYLQGKIERVSLPGLYTVYHSGDSTHIAVNRIRCGKPGAEYAYILHEGRTKAGSKNENWLLILITTFAIVEGLALTNRFRRP